MIWESSPDECFYSSCRLGCTKIQAAQTCCEYCEKVHLGIQDSVVEMQGVKARNEVLQIRDLQIRTQTWAGKVTFMFLGAMLHQGLGKANSFSSGSAVSG